MVAFSRSLPVAETAHIFGARNPLRNYPARYNIAPTQPILTVRFNPEAKERSLDALRWGLVPHWAKDLSFGYKCINARAETVATSPAFRHAFKSRRCIIPASGFYEWKNAPEDKIPYAILPGDELISSTDRCARYAHTKIGRSIALRRGRRGALRRKMAS